MTQKNCYFYPIPDFLPKHQRNPYIGKLIKGLQEDFTVVNASRKSAIGILDLIRYTPRLDFVYFNFIENLPDKRLGIIQSIFLFFYLFCARLLKIKVIWVLHNKLSHNKKRAFLKKILFKALLKRSDVILTHAREGIVFAGNICPGVEKRIVCMHHPADEVYPDETDSIYKEIDILIWGTMNEYKGVYEFLEALKNSGHNQSFKITIAGYFTSEEYYQKVRTFESQSVLIKNDFVSEENLLELFKKSKVILFPYNPISILSSGALMSSLMAPAFLVGPHTAAFADMAEEKVVYTFSDYEQLIGMLEKLISEEELLPATIQIRKDFISHNTWPVFISKVNTLLHGLWS